jgi:hypothetical protein
MMRLCILILCILLIACDSPSPDMRGGARFETEIDEIKVTIWKKRDKVEIIRHGFAYGQESHSIMCVMVQAAGEKTGRRLRPETINGDAGVLRARFACDAAPHPHSICSGSRNSNTAGD